MVKRVGNLMYRIASLENLHEAFLRAARGKSQKAAVVAFRRNLNGNLLAIRQQLLEGCYEFVHYHFFTIFDPKRRTICAASFPDRVVFHAVMRICHPVFDDYQIPDSYASRIGKGTYSALERARTFCCRYEWFAKLDACKYFDSIDHDVLRRQLCRLFKDPQLLLLFDKIIASYSVVEKRGLPIGNLTSQYFANHYLAVADHYAKEQLKIKAMVRYMDDILIFSHGKDELLRVVMGLSHFIKEQLQLGLHVPVINRTCYGVPFLGYIVQSRGLRLNHRSRRRFVDRMRQLTATLNGGQITEREFSMRATCLLAFVNKAEAENFKKNVSKIKGVYPQELESREPWRQLEQRREELPRVESEQQHALEQ